MKRKAIVAMGVVIGCLICVSADARQQGRGGANKISGAKPETGEMVLVPAGEFMMGCNEAVNSECASGFDSPYHKVYLDAFTIDKFEAANSQYQACVQAGGCKAAHYDDGTCWIGADTYLKKGALYKALRGQNKPVVCISWTEAKTYCEWAGKRLPTEAEWEKAARGTDGRKYPWGNEEARCGDAVIDTVLSKEKDRKVPCPIKSTWAVGSRPKDASPYKAMDMAGNVEELVADWYEREYYINSPSRNPTGPSSGTAHVGRGAAWNGDWSSAKVYSRSGAEGPDNYVGFRCARAP